jgi:hypothetical protein
MLQHRLQQLPGLSQRRAAIAKPLKPTIAKPGLVGSSRLRCDALPEALTLASSAQPVVDSLAAAPLVIPGM